MGFVANVQFSCLIPLLFIYTPIYTAMPANPLLWFRPNEN
jgi:hypothetical protein